MADLIIPAVLRTWLVFLLLFVFLGYSPSFSILFGAIGGLAGGLVTGWWQVKGGAPAKPTDLPPIDEQSRFSSDGSRASSRGGSRVSSRWELPFFKPNKARRRYLERTQRARARKLK